MRENRIVIEGFGLRLARDLTRRKRVEASSEIRPERQASSISNREPKDGIRNFQTARLKTRSGMVKAGGEVTRKEKERGSRKSDAR